MNERLKPVPKTLTADSFAQEARSLARCHPELNQIVQDHGLPKFWSRPERFETLVKIILEQQVSLKSAASLYRRIHGELGGMSSRRLKAAGPRRLHDLGMTRQKARYCHELAIAVSSRKLSLKRLRELSDETVVGQLTALPGIGPWTANAYVMLAMGRIDAWPPGDLALLRAIEELLPDEDTTALARTGDRWRPKRAVAARLIWHYYLSTPR